MVALTKFQLQCAYGLLLGACIQAKGKWRLQSPLPALQARPSYQQGTEFEARLRTWGIEAPSDRENLSVGDSREAPIQ